jgi:cAMP-binding proteins - catabolite gene activator and regulatory subunit of cAMP-dependent protein kinases
MKSYISQLQKTSLFAGISIEDIQKICNCLVVHERKIEKNAFVFCAGDEVQCIYLIMSGSMHIINEDFWGNRSLIETMNQGTVFGEAYVLSEAEQHLTSVVAAQDSVVLEMNFPKLFFTCPHPCVCHHKLITNVAYILSTKIVRLTEKVGHIMQRTIREKLCSYLSRCAREEQSNSFDIPYSRQQLADYLHVDRSALSHELSVMRDLNIVKYRKNHFELLN